MRMNFGKVIEIEDLGKHSAGTVINLAILLARTVEARPDRTRKDFYEVESGTMVYYIYASPYSGTISLIASWRKNLLPMPPLELVGCRAVGNAQS